MSSQNITDDLAILGVTSQLARLHTPETLKNYVEQSYRISARQFHPDALPPGSDPETRKRSQQVFKQISQAKARFDTLIKNPERWATIAKALAATRTSSVDQSGGDSTTENSRSVGELEAQRRKLALELDTTQKELNEVTNSFESYTLGARHLKHPKTVNSKVREKETGEKTGIAPKQTVRIADMPINLFAVGSYEFIISEAIDAKPSDSEATNLNIIDAKPSKLKATNLLIKTDENKNLISFTLLAGESIDLTHLLGTSLLGFIDSQTYSELGRGQNLNPRATVNTDAKRIGSYSSAERRIDDTWEISHEHFRSIVLPNLKVHATEGAHLILAKYDGQETRYYVSFEIGKDSELERMKKVPAIRHNPLP